MRARVSFGSVFGQTPRRPWPCSTGPLARSSADVVPPDPPFVAVVPSRSTSRSRSSSTWTSATPRERGVRVPAPCALTEIRALVEASEPSRRRGGQALRPRDGRRSPALRRHLARGCFRLWACRHRWRAPVDETDQDQDQEDAAARLLPPRPRWKWAPSRCASACDLEAWASLARVRPTNAPPPSFSRSTSVSASSRRASGCDTAEAMRALMEESGRAPRRASPWADAKIPETTPDVEPATAASRSSSSSSSSSSDEATKENPDVDRVGQRRTRRRRRRDEARASSGRRGPAAGFGVTCGVLSADETENRVLAVAPGVEPSRVSRTTPSSRTRPRRRRCALARP